MRSAAISHGLLRSTWRQEGVEPHDPLSSQLGGGDLPAGKQFAHGVLAQAEQPGEVRQGGQQE